MNNERKFKIKCASKNIVMKTIKNNNLGNNNTLDILDSIQKVKVSPFFKSKVLNKIEQHKEEKVPLFPWFTPQLQFASLAIILCVNITVIYYSISSTETTEVQLSEFETFVQEYHLESSNSISIN